MKASQAVLADDLAKLIEDHLDPLLVVGSDHRVVFANQGARELLGREHLVGHDPPFPIRTGTLTVELDDEVPLALTVRTKRITWGGDERSNLVLFQEHSNWSPEDTERLAFEDHLTGLPNLNIISQFLEFTLTQARRYDRAAALLVLDLDRFKVVNEGMGMSAGDEILCQTATRLQSIIRSSDVIGRRGEDEFVILLTELSDERSSPDAPETSVMDRAATVAVRVLEVFNEPFLVESQEIHLTTSIGVSLCPNDATTSEQMLGHADSAMYHAKELGRARYQFYTPDLQQRHQRRLTLESGLHAALKREEFRLYYQPIVELASGKVVGLEALLRWDREGELMTAGDFIRVAEESRLIVAIGEWVIESACQQAAQWKSQGRDLFVSVNLSSAQLLGPGLTDHLMASLAAHQLEASQFTVDIREEDADLDPDRAEIAFANLAHHGVKVAIDDFGKGLSSLRQIRRARAHLLKIDRSLISELSQDEESRAIVSAILALADSLELATLAEGIETQSQRDLCLQQGCLYGQGYLFAHPAPADELEQFLDN